MTPARPSRSEPAEPTRSAEVSVRDLTVRYGQRVALRDVSFDVPSGGRLAVIGRSGSGKTTLLRALAGLLAPEAGQIVLGGADASGPSRQGASARISSCSSIGFER